MSFDCPQGFVIPDDPDSIDNVYINKTISECALSCFNPPFFTEVEYQQFHYTELYSAIFGALLSLAVVVLWYKDGVKRKRYFTLIYGITTFCVLIFLVVASSFGRARYCENNANPIGFSHKHGDKGRIHALSVCAGEAATRIFAACSFAAFFCSQSFEVFRKLVLGSKAPSLPWLHSLLVLGIPLACAGGGLAAGIAGTDFGTPICRYNNQNMATLLISLVPTAMFTFLGLIFTLSIITKTVWLLLGGQSIWDTLRLVSTPLHFLLFSGIYIIALIILRFSVFAKQEVLHRDQVMLDWGACALAYFDGTTGSYVANCGAHPDRRTSIAVWCVTAFIIRGGFGFCFFMLNIHGVVAELAKYFCPSVVQPAPYVELPPTSLDTNRAAPASLNMTMLGRETAPVFPVPCYEFSTQHHSSDVSDNGLAVMAMINAEQDDFAIINIHGPPAVEDIGYASVSVDAI